MLRAVVLLVMGLVAAPVAAQEYQSKELAEGAQQYRQELLDSIPANARMPTRIPGLRRDAEADYRAKRYAAAIDELTRAIAYGADDGLVWLRLAQNQLAAEDDHASASAYNAYLKSTDPVERGTALFVIGRDYDRHDKQKEALAAFEAGLAFTHLPAIAERVDQLRRLVAFRVTKVEIEAEADGARACLRFNEKVGTGADLSYGALVRAEPNFDGIVTARDETLCLNGLQHGVNYQVEVLAGFPAATGEKTREIFKTRVVVPDRKPSIAFSGTGYVLPSEGSAGLPVTTINLDRVKLRLLRVNDRNLVPSLDSEKLTMSFSSEDVDEVMNRSGSLVWQGEMAISGERNRAVVTAIPLKDILRDKGPGVYLAVVERPDAKPDEEAQFATNWVLVSDLGLAAYTGRDQMAVDVRSLASGKPKGGIELRLYAHNNALLGAATSDNDGLARFPAGLLHGKGGDEPYAVMAYGPDRDFNFIEIGRGAFDLSDRGVVGRPQPGPVDAFLYTDRGIYRPGEAVQLVALVRDDKADSSPGLPITARLLRPDGVEADKRQLAGDRPGGALGIYHQSYAIPADARMGAWRVEFKLDPKADPIGTAEFQVQDFVPPQLKVELTAANEPVRPAAAFPVQVLANYYYGAPGAGLAVQAEATIALDDKPFPTEPGFQFGLVGEEFSSDRRDLDAPTTDQNGRATVSLSLSDLPDKTRPLAATIRVSVIEPSGRAVSESLTRPIRQRPLAIGLHSPDGEEVAEGAPARVEAIAVDPGGKRIDAKGLRWELLREQWHYEWYSVNGSWTNRVDVRDEPVEAGTFDIGSGDPAALSRTMAPGRYRWEVTDPATGAATSLRFHVGWWVEAELPDVPDKLEAALDKPSYKPGETAHLFVKAPFAGEAELAIASDRILSLRSISLPAEGATIEIPVDAAWGGGAYALVSAYRPGPPPGPPPPNGAAAPRQRGPGRAVGVAWLGIEATARTLSVAIDAPISTRPRQGIELPVKVAGLDPGEEAYVTLAAVDEAVLQLTDFATPAPDKYFFGKRQLGVELRDLYGRLIDANANGVGILRSGGDQFARRSVAGLPDKSSRVVALFSGIVKLDADGNARIRFDIPDFQGQLRLMAVALSAHKVGGGEAKMIVRDPVVTTVSQPRFLAPGDVARIGVAINNLEGAAGSYRFTMSASGAGAFSAPVDRSFALAAGGSAGDSFPLAAAAIGNIAIRMELSGPGDLRIARDFTVGVRPAQSYQLRRFVGQLAAGQSVTLDDGPAAEFLPGTGEAFLTVSPRPDWDVPGLLRALDRYAYGCIEQTTSRALPLLYVEEVAALWRTDPGFNPAQAVDNAIEHVVGMQRSDGSFGVWDDTGDTVPWLDAYATDFLMRAKEHGKNVPDYALKGALNWLRDYTRQDHSDPKDLPALAYAHYDLARANLDDLGALRYFNDTEMASLPTQLARAQLAAALAQYGDQGRAQAAYAAALGTPPKRPLGLRYVDYGTDLRDSAAALAFAARDPATQPRLTTVIDRITELFARSSRTSTQEQAWLLMAAEAAAKTGGGSMTIAVGDAAPETRTAPFYLRRKLGSGEPPTTVANRGIGPMWRAVSITGVVKADLPAENRGYAVTRSVYKPDGTTADLAKARQSDLFVVVIAGTRSDPSRAAQSLVVDLLPAGFEIQGATGKGDSASSYSWLPKLTSATYTEERDDRFVAALDLGAGTKDFTLAYVVRAVTPGEFKYPALVAEDMYEPDTSGRTALGKLTVLPR
ncbi:MAG: alpha-2-macroglobulin family protein [Alphaproteobacteria bacterium]|nr:alpha-2-macroglobulin family protein [Alphaproteobacteria bacterium]